jgi:hypothetical protein
MTQHPALENQPACDEGMEGLQTYQNPMPLSFPDQTGISMYGTVTGNEHTTSMSLQTDDLLYPIPDPDGLNDFWQMPTMVRNPHKPLHTWLNGHRTVNFGSMGPISHGAIISSIRIRFFWIMYYRPQCRA